jgi:hypothetical protein
MMIRWLERDDIALSEIWLPKFSEKLFEMLIKNHGLEGNTRTPLGITRDTLDRLCL